MIEINDSAKGEVLKEEEASDTETGVALGGVGGAVVGAIAGASMGVMGAIGGAVAGGLTGAVAARATVGAAEWIEARDDEKLTVAEVVHEGGEAATDMAIKVGKKVRGASREVAKKTSEVKEAISDKIEEVRDGIHEAKPKDRHVREL